MPSTTFSEVIVVVLTVSLFVDSNLALDVLSLHDRLFKSMDVVGPDVGVIFLFSVETVDFVVNNVEKCWDEL